ncbi:hypothetical protein [Bacillus sp. JJ722]|uniref:hypothetical protein n=1 Tax=Bacillus sp. JJ722 TaxID=3122973 RepID=UPI002FFF1A2B
MRKGIWLLCLALFIVIAGCSSEESAEPKEEKGSGQTTTAPEDKDAEPAVATEPTKDFASMTKEEQQAATGTVEEGGFIKYRGAEWQGDYDNGALKFNIYGVSVTNDIKEAYKIEQAQPGYKAVSVWFGAENTTDKKYVLGLNTAEIVTSTGEQVQMDMYLSKNISGDIHGGVKKEGDIIFVLENTEDVADITSIKFIFDASEEGGSNTKTIEADVKLK